MIRYLMILALIVSCSENPLGSEKSNRDSTPPVGVLITSWVWTLSSPLANSISNDNTPIVELSGAGEENGGKIQLYVDAACAAATGASRTIRNGATAHTDITLDPDGADDGDIDFYVIVEDDSGNSSDCIDISLGYQLAAGTPVVGITFAAVISSTNQAAYDLSGTCSEPGEDVVISVGPISPAVQPVCGINNLWSLTSLDVSAVPEGVVTILADHSDFDANPALQASLNIDKDTVAPTMLEVQGYTWALSSPLDGANSNDATPIIDLSLAAAEDDGSVQIFSDIACAQTQGALQVITAGASNHSDISFATDGTDDGLLTFYTVMTDAAGNPSNCIDISLSYTLDTIAPTVAITTFSNITTANENSYNLGGTCSEPGQDIVISVGGVAPAPQPTCSGGGLWSVVALDVSAASEGAINITSDHDDLAGNTIQASVAISKDTTAPTPAEVQAFTWSLSITPSGAFSNDNTPVIGLADADVEEGAGVQVYDDASCTSTQGVVQSVLTGSTTHADITYLTDNSDDGLIGFYIIMTDAANNVSLCTDISLSYTLDTAPPSVGITTAPDITSANASSYDFDGTCSEVGEVVTVSVGAVPAVMPLCVAGNVWAVVGMDASGAAEGTIAVVANHNDAAGNSAPVASVNINKDATAPTVAEIQAFTWALTSPADGTVSSDGTPIIDLSAAGSIENGSVQVYDDAACTSAQGAAQVVVAGASNHSDITYAIDGSVDGLKHFYVVVTDAALNISACADILLTYTLDTIVPTVAITTSPDINLANASAYSFSGTCSEIGQAVTVSVGGISPAVQPNCIAGNLWSVSALDVSGAAEGSINIFADHIDAALNAATQASVTVNKDAIAPTLAEVQAFIWLLSSPNNGTISVDNTPVINLSAAGSEDGGSVQVYDDAVCLGSKGALQIIVAGVTAHNDITYASDGSDDGPIDFYVSLTDAAGNASVCVDISLGYNLDTQPPTVAITTAPTITALNVTTYAFDGTCSDNGQAVVVSVGAIAPAIQPTCTAGLWSVTGLDVSALSDGSVTVLADHQDIGGNDATQASLNINKDTTAPTLGEVQAFTWVLSSPNNGLTSNDNTPVITLSSAVSEDGGSVQVHDNAACSSPQGVSQTIVAGASNHADITYATDQSDDGLIQFFVVLTDSSSNSSGCVDVSLSYTLDTGAPTVNIVTALDISTVNESIYTINGTCSEVGEVVVVSVGGITPAVQPTCAGLNIWSILTLDVSSLPEGAVTILADHQDIGGNPATQASLVVNKDTTAPTSAAIQAFTWTLSSPINGSTTSDNTPVMNLSGAASEDGGSVQLHDNGTCTSSRGALQTITAGATAHTDITYAIDGSDDGLKSYFVIVTDSVGNASSCTDISRSFTLDTTAPTLGEVQAFTWALSSPGNGTTSPDNTPVIDLSLATTENGGSVQLHDSATCIAVKGASQTITAGATNHSDITYLTGGADDGLIEFYAIVTDTSGNASVCVDISLSYTLDTSPPSVAITSFPDINSINEGAYDFAGTCSENGEEVTVSVGGISPGVQPTCTLLAWSVTGLDVSALAEGGHNILADHSDGVGNNAPQATQAIDKDTIAPTSLAIQAFAWGLTSPLAATTSTDVTPIVSLTGAAAENGGSVQVHDDPVCASSQGALQSIVAGNTTHNDITYTSGGVDDGLIQFYVVITDSAGNPSSCTDVSLSYTLDTVAPTNPEVLALTWTLSSPANGALSNDNTPIMTLTGAGSLNGGSVELYNDAVCTAATGAAQTITGATTTHNDMTYATDGSDDGLIRFYTFVSDAAGNQSACVNISRFYNLDTTDPVVAITASPNITTTSSTSYNFSGTCTEFGRDVTVSVGGVMPAPQPTCAGGNLWSVTGLDVSSLPDGSVTITADHTDAAGNTATQANVVVNKDITGPTDPGSLAVTGWADETTTETLTWTASTDDGFVTHYEVALGQDGGAVDGIVGWTNIGLVLTYTFQDGVDGASFTLTPGVNYQIAVRAIDNDSKQSSEIPSPFFSFFRPTIPSGLKVWNDMQDTTTLFQDTGCITPATTNGDPVGCWQNKVVAGAQFTTAGVNRATHDTTVMSLEFDGTNHGEYTLPFSVITRTAFFMARLDAGYTSTAGLFNQGTSLDAENIRIDNTTDCFRGNGLHGEDTTDFSRTVSNGMRIDGAIGECVTPGTSFIMSNQRATLPAFVPQIGQLFSGRAWRGGIQEVIIYNSAIDTTTREKVEGYLACRWDIRSQLPIAHPFYNATPGIVDGCP